MKKLQTFIKLYGTNTVSELLAAHATRTHANGEILDQNLNAVFRISQALSEALQEFDKDTKDQIL